MNKIYLCADTHFGHNNIIKYENRPFKDADDMNEGLIALWNNTVSKEDKVFLLGDVAFVSKAKIRSIVPRLHGYKVLILGNHDRNRSPKFWMEAGFDEVSAYPIVYKDKYILMHEPPDDLYEKRDGYFRIYGHVHGDPSYLDHTDTTACVSIERLGFKPALFEDVVSGKAYEGSI